MSLKAGDQSISVSRAPNFGSKITPSMSNGAASSTRLNAYSNMTSQMAGNSRVGDISMSIKNNDVSASKFGSSLRLNPFKPGMNMLSRGRTNARATKLAMSASFNITGSTSNNKLIDNYQDMSMGAAK